MSGEPLNPTLSCTLSLCTHHIQSGKCVFPGRARGNKNSRPCLLAESSVFLRQGKCAPIPIRWNPKLVRSVRRMFELSFAEQLLSEA